MCLYICDKYLAFVNVISFDETYVLFVFVQSIFGSEYFSSFLQAELKILKKKLKNPQS